MGTTVFKVHCVYETEFRASTSAQASASARMLLELAASSSSTEMHIRDKLASFILVSADWTIRLDQRESPARRSAREDHI
jgi:hypothetical protein